MIFKSTKKEKIFAPDFEYEGVKNIDRPESEQLRAEVIHFPTNGEAQTFKSFRFTTDLATELVYKDLLMLTRCIGKLWNCEDENGVVIKNGTALANSDNLNLGVVISAIREYLLGDGSEEKEISEGES